MAAPARSSIVHRPDDNDAVSEYLYACMSSFHDEQRLWGARLLQLSR